GSQVGILLDDIIIDKDGYTRDEYYKTTFDVFFNGKKIVEVNISFLGTQQSITKKTSIHNKEYTDIIFLTLTPLQNIQINFVSLRQSLARFEAGADLRTCSPVSAEQGIGFEAIIQIYF
ncbi:hypothetical protein, partial [uncultured Ruminococcus sp.]|uniref:hypothetical protein n=1 Tax=uncultured Ruminococcus sp. TaxID=165186 RepID=UPI00292F33B9